MKIAIYSRKSIFTGKGDSIENQILLCQKYCDSYLKDKKPEYIIYEDEGFSGKNINRPKFKQLLDDIKSKKIELLICYRLDRISRNVADFSSTLELLQQNNVDFISIKEQFDTSTPMGRAMIYIASVFAQLERETIAERVKDNMMQMAKAGKWSGGQLPLGYSSEKFTYVNEEFQEKSFSKLVPVEKEIEIIQYIFDIYLLKHSIRGLARDLNIKNIKTKAGFKFDLTQIKRILRNPLYAQSNPSIHEYLQSINYNVFGEPNGNGYLTYNKKTDKDNLIAAVSSHKGVIESNKWLEAQIILDNNRDRYSARIGTGLSNALFVGLLKCGKCKSNMIVQYNTKDKHGNNYLYYACSNRQNRHGESKCDCPNLRVDLVDPKIIDGIKSYNEESILKIYNEMLKKMNFSEAKTVVTNLNSQISKKESQIHNLIIQMSNTPNQAVANLLMEQITNLNMDIDNLKLKIDNEDNLMKFKKDEIKKITLLSSNYSNFQNQFDVTDDFTQKRNLIQSITETIIYNPDDDEFIYNPIRLNNIHFDNTSESMDFNLYTS